MAVTFEWDRETVDEYDDIVDHDHRDRLSDFLDPIESNQRLVLVRHRWDQFEGLVDRQWAYVENGQLPERFADTLGEERCKVPSRFHTELTKAAIAFLLLLCLALPCRAQLKSEWQQHACSNQTAWEELEFVRKGRISKRQLYAVMRKDGRVPRYSFLSEEIKEGFIDYVQYGSKVSSCDRNPNCFPFGTPEEVKYNARKQLSYVSGGYKGPNAFDHFNTFSFIGHKCDRNRIRKAEHGRRTMIKRGLRR